MCYQKFFGGWHELFKHTYSEGVCWGDGLGQGRAQMIYVRIFPKVFKDFGEPPPGLTKDFKAAEQPNTILAETITSERNKNRI